MVREAKRLRCGHQCCRECVVIAGEATYSCQKSAKKAMMDMNEPVVNTFVVTVRKKCARHARLKVCATVTRSVQ